MNSIRRSLLTSLLIGLGLVLTGAGTTLYYRTRAVLTREFDAALHSEATAVISLTEQDHGKVELDLADVTPPEYFRLWLPGGQTLGCNDLSRGDGDIVLPDGRPGRAVSAQFIPKPADEELVKPSGPVVTLVVARNRLTLDRTLAGMRAGLVIVGALVLAATALVVTWTVRRGLAPLDALGAAIETSSVQTRFSTDTMPGELRPIGERLNDLLARLDEAFQRERRISADIAHELRTPIAELRALAEVALKWPDDAAPFRDALAIAQKMETMVIGLLALARCETGKQPLASEPVAIRELVADVWTPLEHRARQRQLQVTIAIEGDATLKTDPTLLRLVVSNLLANAVEHAPERGMVRVSNGEAILQVSNTTDNLTANDLSHLFERFWRKDASRTATGHSGLGLALAKAAAASIELELSAEMPDATTLRLSLTRSARR